MNEEKFELWLRMIKEEFDKRETAEIAGRGCLEAVGELCWYGLNTLRQLDCMDCFIAGWKESRRSIREDFK